MKNNLTYDALASIKERENFYSFDSSINTIRGKVLEDTRKKIFFDMDIDSSAIFARRTSEKAIFYYISVGDITKIAEILGMMAEEKESSASEFGAHFGEISENARLQSLSILISTVTLCTRAAVDGGLPEIIAYSLSDCYIGNALGLTDGQKIMELLRCVIYDFTYEVYKYKYRNCSVLVKKCCEYINRHLHDDIRLSTLGELTGKSPTYISDLFQKDLGIRPIVYMRKLKLAYAYHVLETADVSVSAIAELLAFPSTSSFITYFSKEYGQTPLNFRKSRIRQ